MAGARAAADSKSSDQGPSRVAQEVLTLYWLRTKNLHPQARNYRACDIHKWYWRNRPLTVKGLLLMLTKVSEVGLLAGQCCNCQLVAPSGPGYISSGTRYVGSGNIGGRKTTGGSYMGYLNFK
ncbi:MAG: hypothetical protein U5L96_04735 [Owenweeksia sp.]|nr:hypothetical protein [Owenweeksia sp.]